MGGGFPTKVDLDPADAAALKNLAVQQEAVQEYMQTVTMQCQQRLAQVKDQGKNLWQRLAEKYKLDLETVSYGLARDGKSLTPIAVRLTNGE